MVHHTLDFESCFPDCFPDLSPPGRSGSSAEFEKLGLSEVFEDLDDSGVAGVYDSSSSGHFEAHSPLISPRPDPQRSLSSSRPLPDQSAFDTSRRNSFSKKSVTPQKSPICPPTPVRTPSWAHDGPMPMERKSSLCATKTPCDLTIDGRSHLQLPGSSAGPCETSPTFSTSFRDIFTCPVGRIGGALGNRAQNPVVSGGGSWGSGAELRCFWPFFVLRFGIALEKGLLQGELA